MEVVLTTTEALGEHEGMPGETLVVMPFTDAAMARRAAAQLARRAGAGGRILCVHDTHRSGFIAVANAVFRRCRADTFAYVAQDVFAGREWLALGLVALNEREGGLLGFNDGKWGGQLASFGLVRREWAAGIYGGDLFHPGYQAHYADAELTLVAMQQLKYRFDPLAMLVEVDWNKESAAVTAEDRLLYYQRGKTQFDGLVTNAMLRRLFT